MRQQACDSRPQHSKGRVKKDLLPLILSLLSVVLPVAAQDHGDRSRDLADVSANHGPVPMIHLKAEQLPDLNIPRAGHEMFCVNGE